VPNGAKSAKRASAVTTKSARKPAKKKAASAKKPRAAAARTGGAKKPARANDLTFRLSPTLRARAYRLQIAVDPSKSAQYTGRVELDATLDSEQREL